LLLVGVVVVAEEEVPSSTLMLMDTIEDEAGAFLLAATLSVEGWTGKTNASDREAATRRTRAARRRKSGLGVATMVAARRAMVSSSCMMVGRQRGEEVGTACVLWCVRGQIDMMSSSTDRLRDEGMLACPGSSVAFTLYTEDASISFRVRISAPTKNNLPPHPPDSHSNSHYHHAPHT